MPIFSVSVAFLAGAAAGVVGSNAVRARRRRAVRAVLTFSLASLVDALRRLGEHGDLPYHLGAEVDHCAGLARTVLRVVQEERPQAQ